MAAKGRFKLPTAAQIGVALGELPADPSLASCFRVLPEHSSFQKMRRPRPGDWLASHPETGQSLKSFQRSVYKAQPHATYKTIYIQPLGDFTAPDYPKLSRIATVVQAFFTGCEVTVLKQIPFNNKTHSSKLSKRTNEDTQQDQYLIKDIYQWISDRGTQKALGIEVRKNLLTLVVTTADVYPGEEWNFVYGQADMMNGVGVWSFARLNPLFPHVSLSLPDKKKHADAESKSALPKLTPQQRGTFFVRCTKILLHETGHLFGLKHCVYYTCLMNGANHEEEMDRQRLYLCPVCLRKLHDTLKFDPIRRYQDLMHQWTAWAVEEESNEHSREQKTDGSSVQTTSLGPSVVVTDSAEMLRTAAHWYVRRVDEIGQATATPTATATTTTTAHQQPGNQRRAVASTKATG